MDFFGFRAKRMKVTDEEILTAVDREIYAKQIEKLRIRVLHGQTSTV